MCEKNRALIEGAKSKSRLYILYAMKEKVLLTWSGGKDSALALWEMKRSRIYEISAMLTTITEDYKRVSMHGVRKDLLEIQMESLGYPLQKVFIPKDCTNERYEQSMREILKRHLELGVSSVAFGDINLEEVRKYRENNLSKMGIKAIFPLWRMDTAELANRFVSLGFKAVVTCVDSKVLDRKFVGMEFDERFLGELPQGIDPCGENGEFHTFVYDGPIFKYSVPWTRGEVVVREKRFYYCDLVSV